MFNGSAPSNHRLSVAPEQKALQLHEAAAMGGMFDDETLAWWLPSSYVAIISLWYLYPAMKRVRATVRGKGAAVVNDLLNGNATEPLLSDNYFRNAAGTENDDGTWIGREPEAADGPGDYAVTGSYTSHTALLPHSYTYYMPSIARGKHTVLVYSVHSAD
jgi:hypothetical protein